MRNNESNGKAIDFAIIRIETSKNSIPKVHITVMDITIGKALRELEKKIKGFVESFKNFE
jgi:hypothetical protein